MQFLLLVWLVLLSQFHIIIRPLIHLCAGFLIFDFNSLISIGVIYRVHHVDDLKPCRALI